MFKNLSDNLNMLMAKARLNSSELAKAVGLPATTVKRIRTQTQSNPTVATLLPIAKYFAVTVSELLGCEPLQLTRNTTAYSAQYKQVPILSWQECVNFATLDYTKITTTTVTAKAISDAAYALTIPNAEYRIFPKASIIIVEPALTPLAGDYIIVTSNEHHVAAIKKYILEADQIYLKSVISGLGITPWHENCESLGVIVEYKVELR